MNSFWFRYQDLVVEGRCYSPNRETAGDLLTFCSLLSPLFTLHTFNPEPLQLQSKRQSCQPLNSADQEWEAWRSELPREWVFHQLHPILSILLTLLHTYLTSHPSHILQMPSWHLSTVRSRALCPGNVAQIGGCYRTDSEQRYQQAQLRRAL